MTSGAKYLKPVRIARKAAYPPVDTRRRTAGKPYLPPVNDSVPPVDRYIYLVHLNTGAYYGWMEEKEGNKWLFTMYYPTDNKYKIKTIKPNRYVINSLDSARSHKVVYEVASDATALVFVNKMLAELDLVDTTDIKAMVDATKKAVNDADIAHYTPSDPFNLLKDTIPTARSKYLAEKQPYEDKINELRHEMERRIAEVRQQIVDGPVENLRKRLLDRLDDIANAEAEKAKGSEEAGGNLDF